MPHIVIEGKVSAEDIALAFRPAVFTEGTTRFKAEEIFLAQDKLSAIIRTLTVERGFTKNFFVRVSNRGGGVSLATEKIGQPDASDGVKRLLGIYAWIIIQSTPDAVISNTDIPDFVGEPKP